MENPMTRQPASKTAGLERVYKEELEKAFPRIGETSFEATAWLVRFAKAPIDSLSQGALMDLGWEINYLADFRLITGELPYWGIAASEKDWAGRRRFEGEGVEESLSRIVLGEFYRPPMGPPTLNQIKSLQQFVAKLLADRMENDSFHLTLPSLDIIAAFPKDAILSAVVLTFAGSPQLLFKHNVASLLLKHAQRIRRCPKCQKTFFADRKNKLYCTSKCQNTAAVKRLRQAASDNKRKKEILPKTSKKPKAKTFQKRGK
jgi:ribosomal protein S27AE